MYLRLGPGHTGIVLYFIPKRDEVGMRVGGGGGGGEGCVEVTHREFVC